MPAALLPLSIFCTINSCTVELPGDSACRCSGIWVVAERSAPPWGDVLGSCSVSQMPAITLWPTVYWMPLHDPLRIELLNQTERSYKASTTRTDGTFMPMVTWVRWTCAPGETALSNSECSFMMPPIDLLVLFSLIVLLKICKFAVP